MIIYGTNLSYRASINDQISREQQSFEDLQTDDVLYYNKAHLDLQWNEIVYENYVLQRIDNSCLKLYMQINIKLEATFLMTSSTPPAGKQLLNLNIHLSLLHVIQKRQSYIIL